MRTLAIGITPLSCCCGGGSSTSPAIRLSGLGIFQEDIAAAAPLGTLSVVNVTGTPTYSLTDSDGGRVILTGANLTRGIAWDYETHPIVTATISVSGVTPTIAPRTFLLFATNVLEVTLAALGLSPSTILEGSTAGTVVGAITGKTGGSSLALTDDGGGRFAISGTNLVTTAIPTDYETSTLHAITIRETHPDAAPRDTALAVTVTDVSEITLAPLTLSANTILEGSAAGTVVGAILGQTSGSTLELFDDAGDRFAFGAAGDPTLKLDLDFTTGTLDSKVTFTRLTTATHYGADGKLRNAPHNVLLQSQNLAIAPWSNDGITAIANAATAPDGTSTATLLTAPGTAAENVFTYQSTVTGIADLAVYTISIYVKKSVGDWCALRAQSGTIPRAYFNLTTGTAGAIEAGIISSAIVDAGNGWYRISATRAEGGAGGNEFLVVHPCDANSSPAVTAGKAIYAWGAQMEVNSSASLYVPTTTAASYNGPRFDHNPSTLAPRGLLLEEQRTNQCLHSEDFAAAGYWALHDTTFVGYAAGIVDPAGGAKATEITFGTSAGDAASALYQGIGGFPVGAPATFSVWARAKTGTTTVRLWIFDGGANYYKTADLPIVSTEWRRLSLTATVTPAGAGQVSIRNNVAGTSGGIYVFGAQLEFNAPFATSYIPTTSAAVTRAADSATITGTNFSSWFNQNAWTLVMDFQRLGHNPAWISRLWEMSGGIFIRDYGSGADVYVGAAGPAVFFTITPGLINNKHALALAANDLALSVNGATTQTAVPTLPTPVLYDNFVFGNDGGGTAAASMWMKRMKFYNVRKTNAELQTLAAP